MIHVDRSRVPMPKVIDRSPKSPASIERAQAAEFFGKRFKLRAQRRFDFKVYRHASVIDALTELFHGKCAYCEARTTHVAPLDVEMFRPKSAVTEAPAHPGYWWLAADWSNLLAACQSCNRLRANKGIKTGKANRFPLADESMRASGPRDALSREQPLLLDPCSDNPELHLVFSSDGRVVSATARGQKTIAILGLNRPGLVEARRAAAGVVEAAVRNVTTLFDRIKKNPTRKGETERLEDLLTELRAMTEASQEFAGLKRQLIKPALDAMRAAGMMNIAQVAASWESQSPVLTSKQIQQAHDSQQAFESTQSSYSMKSAQGRETYRSQRRQIEHVSIRGFKGIESLDLDLCVGDGQTGWLMLLGENGTGKSSVLQAIALTLAGADYFTRIAHERGLDLRELVNNRASLASIEVKVSGFVGPHVLELTPTKATFRKPNGDAATVKLGRGKSHIAREAAHSGEAQNVVLAYGATRLLPRAAFKRYGISYARVDNLFDPFLPLFNADDWLMAIDRSAFDRVAIVLKDLLGLEDESQLVRVRGRVMVEANGDKVTLRQLSDGYQAVIAMSVDMLEVAHRLWPDLAEAEGVVLLDEIGSHLHPLWKMRIVSSLRRAFPGMQFIATTHEPLCLRGLGEGEVAVMQRDEASRRIEAVTGLPSPADFRIDQLLTSEFFGLNTTVDAETESLFDEYYALLATTKLSTEQRARLEQLKAQLQERRYMGVTLRDQLMNEAIDKLVARQKHGQRRSMPQLKKDAVAAIARMWSETTGGKA